MKKYIELDYETSIEVHNHDNGKKAVIRTEGRNRYSSNSCTAFAIAVVEPSKVAEAIEEGKENDCNNLLNYNFPWKFNWTH